MRKPILSKFRTTLQALKKPIKTAISKITLSDILIVNGGVSLFAGVYVQFGLGWSLIAGGMLNLLIAALPHLKRRAKQ